MNSLYTLLYLLVICFSVFAIEPGEQVELDPDLIQKIKKSVEEQGSIPVVKKDTKLSGDEKLEKGPDITIIDDDAINKFGQKITDSNSKPEVVEEEKINDSEKKPNKQKIFNITEYRLLRNELADGRLYAVYDGIIPARIHLILKHYLTYNHEAWLFNNYDSIDITKQRSSDNTAWVNSKDPLEFSKMRLCKRLVRAINDMKQTKGEYYPYKVFGKIIRRGDHTKVFADSSDSDDVSVMVFLNEFWRKNYYGELYLYDSKREIVGGATHKSGRVVVWDSTILRLNRPPAVQFLQGQVLFHVVFSTNKEKMMENNLVWLKHQQERKTAYIDWNIPDYKLPDGNLFEAPEPREYKKFEYTTKTDNRKIYVFDNLFSKDLLDHLRGFVLKHGSYFYDDSIDDSSDNVQWIAGFFIDPYIESPFWKVVKKVATYASGNEALFPYDVSINLVRNADHTRIHSDVGYYGEEEFTCLVYLNPNWTRNDYGETTFFEKNSDDTEIVAQVRPRYGRTVIFDGNIPHSARPPSFNFSGARLTFVTKLHKNEFTGRKKNFQEEMRHVRGSLDGLKEIIRLGTSKGETYARKLMEERKTFMEKMTFRPEREGDEQGDDDDNDDDGDGDERVQHGADDEDESKFLAEQKINPPERLSETSKTSEARDLIEELTEGEFDELPKEIQEIYMPLKGVTEGSNEGVEKIKEAYMIMRSKCRDIMKSLDEIFVKVL